MFQKMMAIVIAVIIGGAATGLCGPNPVIKPYHQDSMFKLYQENRENGIPNYITTDFIVASYSIFLNDLLTEVEEQEIFPLMTQLISETLASIQAGDRNAPGVTLSLAYLSVLMKLLNPETRIPDEVSQTVTAELKLISEQKDITPSFITGIPEDFSQYIPRGKYTGSENLKRYFRALMYAGRIGFYLKPSEATGVTPEMADQHTAAALTITKTILKQDRLKQLYDKMDRLLTFFVGKTDDLTIHEYLKFSETLSVTDARNQIWEHIKKENRLPRIISMMVDQNKLEPGTTVYEVAASFKLLGQRYTVDSEVFQTLTFHHVTEYTGRPANPMTMAVINGKKVRGFPTVLDIMMGIGSVQARGILQKTGDIHYKGYDDQLKRSTLLLKDRAFQPETLADMNLNTMYSLITSDPKSAEMLNAAVGFWIQNRHAMVLYAKQSYSTVSKSVGQVLKRENAFIEPSVAVYATMIENLFRIASVLNKNKHSEDSPYLQRIKSMQDMMTQIRTLALKQKENQLKTEDYHILNNLDLQFLKLLSSPDYPIAVDVHTEPNTKLVLQEAIGYPLAVTLNEFRGARFNCYEFKHPMDQRLTDDAWAKLLEANKVKESLTEKILKISK